MRVLHVVPYFPPERIGGVGEVAAHLHRGLLAAGHESQVLTSGTGADDPLIHRVAASPAGFLANCLRHTGLIRDCDLVHGHHGDLLPLFAAMRWPPLRRKLLLTYHLSSRGLAAALRPHRLEGRWFGRGWRGWSERHLKTGAKRLLDRLAMGLADELSFISRSAARDVLGAEAAAAATVIYNGLPAPAAAAATVAPAEPTELLYVGTASLRKRTHLLPYVLRAVRRERPRARLRIVGFELDGPLRQLFAEQQVLEAVVCEGPRRSDQIAPFYRAAGVLVVPSIYEGLPMVILEGFQHGLPSVVTRVSGHPEVVEDGLSGFLVDPDDPAQLAARCLEILARPDGGRAMGEAGRALVAKRFGLERQVREYLRLYEAMLGKSEREPA